jgi:hypothetical protein
MKQLAWGILATGLVSTTVMAQSAVPDSDRTDRFLSTITAQAPAGTVPVAPAAPEPPASSPVTVTVGADFPTLYFFRGLRQEADSALTFQPFVDVGITASDTVSFNVGTWNSLHSGSNSDAYDNAWYESDIYGSATFTAGKWKPGLLFTAYTSPANAYDTVSELAGVLAYDDSASAVPISPKVTVAFELSDATADGGANKGIYLELGGKPSFTAGPVTIGVPLKVGLSLKDYYEDPLTGEDNTFGYFDVGLSAGVPLSFLHGGSWEAHGGVDFYTLGDGLPKLLNADKTERVVGSIGFSVAF